MKSAIPCSCTRRPSLWLAALGVGVLLIGCEKTEAPRAATGASVVLYGDEAVLRTLDPYNPVWRLDEDGRVYHLKLEGKRLLEPAVFDEVCKLTELKHLSLYGANIGDDSLLKLQCLKNLEALGIGATLITDKGLAHLENLHALRYVWVSRDRVTTEKVEELKLKCPGLTVYLQ